MASGLLLILICVSCLMFLGILYGERLNVSGFAESVWTLPVGALFGRIWDGLTEAVDESVEFLLTHLSWVIAATSGTSGLLLVIFLMGGGLTADAASWHRDVEAPLQSGGVIDQVPEIVSQHVGDGVRLASLDLDDSQYVTQAFSRDYYVFNPPELDPVRPKPRRPIDGGVIDVVSKRPAGRRAELDVTFRRLGSSVIRDQEIPTTLVRGRLEDSLPDTGFVDRAVRSLLRDNWREGLGLPVGRDDGVGLPGDVVPESPAASVSELESRIRITPGVLVSEHDLRVEKSFPEESATGEVTIQVTVTNLTSSTIDGLLVREIMPLDTLVRGAQPEGVLREGTMTWLISGLRPSQEKMLRFTVLPSDGSRRLRGSRDSVFESVTEVSAVTAVTTRTIVEDEVPLPDPFPSDRTQPSPRLPEVTGRPELRLRISEPRETSAVGKWTSVLFRVSNAGTTAASDVTIRLTLAEELDHHALLDEPSADRQVIVNVRRLRAGETRDFQLEVRPTRAGEIVSTAELLHENAQIELDTFQLVARDADELPPFDGDSTIR